MCAAYGVEVVRLLGGRASTNWLVRRDGAPAVLRRHGRPLWQSVDQLAAAVDWRSRARRAVAEHGWPVAESPAPPRVHDGEVWEIETFLPGSPRPLSPSEHAGVIAGLHALPIDLDALGPQPGRLDHLAVLTDPTVEADLTGCDDAGDVDRLLRRLDQARGLAAGIDWSASRPALVHGDLAAHNLLFEGERFSGLLDFELATVDRRVVDLILAWRHRHDDLVIAYDTVDPLNPHEWRMLPVDWWALLISLAAVQLRHGKQPDRWELDGLRRASPLAARIDGAGAGP